MVYSAQILGVSFCIEARRGPRVVSKSELSPLRSVRVKGGVRPEDLGLGIESARAAHAVDQVGLRHLHDLPGVSEIVVGPLVDDLGGRDGSGRVVLAGALQLPGAQRAQPGYVLLPARREIIEQLA